MEKYQQIALNKFFLIWILFQTSQTIMHSAFHQLFKRSHQLFLPLISVGLLHLSTKPVSNAVQQNGETQTNLLNDAQFVPNNLQQQQKLPWDWDRIIQIDSPQQLSHADILSKTIIVYQMTGNKEIDSQVALLSHLFCDKYFGKISENFQFVFLTYNPQVPTDEDLLFVAFGKQGSKYIPLKKYVNTEPSKKKFIPNYTPLFTRILEEVNKYQELSFNNIYQHLEHLNCEGRDTYQLVVVSQNNSEQQINRSKHVIQKFLKNKEIWNSEIVKAVVTDPQTKTILGLNDEEIQPNKVYMIAPKNQNLIRKPAKTFNILSKKYTVIPADQIQKEFIFPPIPPQLSQQSYILKFNIDLNQTRPELVTALYDNMRDEKLLSELRISKLLTFSKGEESIEITIQKNNHDSIIHAYDPDCMYEEKYKKDLLLKSNVWKYPHDHLDPEKLKDFVQTVLNRAHDPELQAKKSQLEYFKSQPETQSVRKFSKLITGQERVKTIFEDNDKVIFHYSKSCHSCKRFGGNYEDIASQTKDVKFYRIDNDTNKTAGLKNYNSTPIFVMYKKGYPTLPWYFKMPYFTKSLFSNFIEITKSVEVMNPQTLKNHIKSHVENENLVKQTLKQVL